MATKLFDAGKGPAATRAKDIRFSVEMDTEPTFGMVLERLASKRSKEDPEKALELLDKALLLTHGHPRTWRSMGLLLHEQGKHAEALKALDEAANGYNEVLEKWQHIPDLVLLEYAGVCKWKGTALCALGRHGEALDLFDKAIIFYKLSKDSFLPFEPPEPLLHFVEDSSIADTLTRKGKALVQLSRSEEALDVLGKAIITEKSFGDGISWQHAEALQLKADALKGLGREDEAKSASEESKKVEEELEKVRRKQYEKALEDRKAVIEFCQGNKKHLISIQHATAWRDLANALNGLGRAEEADEALKKAKSIEEVLIEKEYPKHCESALSISDEWIVIHRRDQKHKELTEELRHKADLLKELGRKKEAEEALAEAKKIEEETARKQEELPPPAP